MEIQNRFQLATTAELFALGVVLCQLPCLAQGGDDAQLNSMLNSLDSNTNWQALPISGSNTNAAPTDVPRFNSPGTINPMHYPMMQKSGQSQTVPKQYPFSPRQILRTFFEGSAGGSSSGGAKIDPNALGNAYGAYQRAENAAQRSYNASQRALYNGDKWARQNAASEAQYAADAARYAADQAYAAGQRGDSSAQGYASQARAAADRAQGDADRAKYNASLAQ